MTDKVIHSYEVIIYYTTFFTTVVEAEDEASAIEQAISTEGDSDNLDSIINNLAIDPDPNSPFVRLIKS